MCLTFHMYFLLNSVGKYEQKNATCTHLKNIFNSYTNCKRHTCFPNRREIPNSSFLCSGEQVVKSLVCQVFVCMGASMCVCMCLAAYGMPLLSRTSVFGRMCKCGCGFMRVCVVYQLAGQQWSGWRCNVCTTFFPI